MEIPACWYVCFYEMAATPWVRWLPGRFKHVAAFGFLPASETFVMIDPALNGWHVVVLPIESEVLADAVSKAVIVRIPAEKRGVPPVKLLLTCVSAVRMICEIPGGALRPDGLLRDCLRIEGAEVIADGPVQAKSLQHHSA